jgi:hypothetical protein
MEKREYLEDFFIEDEHSFQEGKVQSFIERCKKHAKLIGKKGDVHIENRGLTGTEKIKLLLVTRYLGGELAKLEPKLGISVDVANVSSSEIAKLLSVSNENARTRISDLVEEGFGIRPQKGYIRVLPHQVDKFLQALEGKDQAKLIKVKKGPARKAREVKESKKHLETQEINSGEVIKRLSANLNISQKHVQDALFISNDGSFKFNKLFGGRSKLEKQVKCILCTTFVLTIGLGSRTLSSREIRKVCFHSNVDVSGLNYAIRDLKRRGYLTKAGRRSQDNIILEKGKDEAKKIFSELCN